MGLLNLLCGPRKRIKPEISLARQRNRRFMQSAEMIPPSEESSHRLSYLRQADRDIAQIVADAENIEFIAEI